MDVVRKVKILSDESPQVTLDLCARNPSFCFFNHQMSAETVPFSTNIVAVSRDVECWKKDMHVEYSVNAFDKNKLRLHSSVQNHSTWQKKSHLTKETDVGRC